VQRTAEGYDAAVTDERAFEVLDANSFFMLTTEEGGFAIWRTDDDDEAPLTTFPATDDGADAAWEAFRRMSRRARRARWRRVPAGALKWTAIVSAIVWVIARLVGSFWFALETTSASIGSNASRWLAWVQFADQFAFAVFVSAVGLYVMLWLEGRSTSTVPRSPGADGRGSGLDAP
jgi:hypothetical protein